ncbi:MAG: hypothetical protein MK194_14155, partial [Roseibacillus sp.]|nr:hypothetical protein [Roseibacillus sp.]
VHALGVDSLVEVVYVHVLVLGVQVVKVEVVYALGVQVVKVELLLYPAVGPKCRRDQDSRSRLRR